MKEGTLKIHSENILPIIKKWLYSEKDIFARELVSNSCDAISKLKQLVSQEDDYKIEVVIDSENKKIIFRDNGLGMDHEEVEKYIAQLAFSGAEEFVKQYDQSKAQEPIIGHFGLGFYSSFMVSDKVDIHTLSYKEGAEGVFWSSDGSSTYTIGKKEKEGRGTEVTLHLSADEEEYLNDSRLKKILTNYCGFLPYPILLNGVRVNEVEPLWIKAPSECTDKEYTDFYHTLFPSEPEPLFWIHLNVDYPFNLKGILYFPKVKSENEFSKKSIKLFCNRVFVSESCQDLIPDYLMLLRGCIDSPDIPLNVSRSYLQMDRTVRQVGQHIAKKIADRLSHLYSHEREKFISFWPDLETIIKFGVLQDEKFYEKVKDFLIWKNCEGLWTTVEEVLERSQGKELFYTQDERQADAFIQLYKQKGIEVLVTAAHILDQSLIQFLERKTGAKFKRIDSALEGAIIDLSKEKTILDGEGKSEGSRLADLFRAKLEGENLEVEAKSLASDSLFGFLMIKEEERRMRDALAMRDKSMLSLMPLKPTFVINTNSKLINAMLKVEKRDPELAKEMAISLYDLARLSSREMEPEGLATFITRSGQVLENLACKLTDETKM